MAPSKLPTRAEVQFRRHDALRSSCDSAADQAAGALAFRSGWRRKTQSALLSSIQKLTLQHWTFDLLRRISLAPQRRDNLLGPARPAGPRKFESSF